MTDKEYFDALACSRYLVVDREEDRDLIYEWTDEEWDKYVELGNQINLLMLGDTDA